MIELKINEINKHTSGITLVLKKLVLLVFSHEPPDHDDQGSANNMTMVNAAMTGDDNNKLQCILSNSFIHFQL